MKYLLLLISIVGSSYCHSAFSSPVTSEFVFGSIGKKTLRLEVADSPIKRAVGLMQRTNLGEDEGMIFVFPKADFLSFWMKSTLIPLSLGYFGEDLKLIEIYDMKPNQTKEVYNSTRPAKYAVELNQGWFRKNKIDLDSPLTLEKKISALD